MARGKQTCKILKDIRRQIAQANDIEFVTSECRYKGDCLGTCPKCEAEVRYLEQQLRSRQLMGKAVVLTGLSAGMIAFSGCGGTSNQTADDSYRLQGEPMEMSEGDDEWDVEGELPVQEVIDSIREEAIKKKGEVGSEDETIISPTNLKQESAATKTVKCPASFSNTEASDSTEAMLPGAVELQPEFLGGNAAMLNFIAKNLKYPKEQLDSGIQGRVIVKFYVDTLGNVCEPTIVRGKDSALDREAIRVVSSFPQFIPGELSGKKVKVQMVIPIVFKLPAK